MRATEEGAISKHLIVIHGRNFKPDQHELEALWLNALRGGIARDFGDGMAEKFDSLQKTLAYYGDISNEFLRAAGKNYNEQEDLQDRKKALATLMSLDQSAFVGQAGKENYKKLPGRSSWRGRLADIGDALRFPALGKLVMGWFLSDMKKYWSPDTQFGSDVRWRMTVPLEKALREDQDVLIISHSLGTLIAYDVLWKFSHYGEYQDIRQRKVSVWVTLGSPLGDETNKRSLKGSAASPPRRYPHNIRRWVNVAANDDVVSHDGTVADDYREMQRRQLVDSIRDHRIYNLASSKWQIKSPPRGRLPDPPGGVSSSGRLAGFRSVIFQMGSTWLLIEANLHPDVGFDEAQLPKIAESMVPFDSYTG